jgi:hypothetical protein
LKGLTVARVGLVDRKKATKDMHFNQGDQRHALQEGDERHAFQWPQPKTSLQQTATKDGDERHALQWPQPKTSLQRNP